MLLMLSKGQRKVQLLSQNIGPEKAKREASVQGQNGKNVLHHSETSLCKQGGRDVEPKHDSSYC